MTNKKKMMHWRTFKYHLEQVTKISFKNSFACKSVFKGKRFAILFQNKPFSY
jgi:hypothetical protein